MAEPAVPPIDIEGKSIEEILLEIGDIPYYLVRRRPEWQEMSEEDIRAEIEDMHENILLRLSDYYCRMGERGELTDMEGDYDVYKSVIEECMEEG